MGPISDDEPEHALLRFKLHALRCNEAFLLAADVVATVLSRTAATLGAAADCAAVREAANKWIRHFQPDGPRLWWDVALQPQVGRISTSESSGIGEIFKLCPVQQ